MSEINLHNYEAFFLDYLEGNLNEADQMALNDFLSKNPELKAELGAFENVSLEAETIEFPKESLLREEETGLARKDYLIIGSIEDTLNEEEQSELATLIEKSPALINEIALYEKTKLPEDGVFYPSKSELKKKPKVIYWQFYATSVSVAAAVLALFFFNNPSVDPLYQLERLNSISYSSAPIDKSDFNYVLSSEVPEQSTKSTDYMAAKVDVNKPSELPKNELESIQPNLPFEDLAESTDKKAIQKEDIPQIEEVVEDLASVEPVVESVEIPADQSAEELPLKEYAKQKFNEEVLQNKTVSEVLAEEIADLTKDKINLSAGKKGLQFAMNFGNFSISKK